MGTEVQRVLVDRALMNGGFSSYAEMARRMGVEPPTLSQWRAGDGRIPPKRLEQLCAFADEDLGTWAMMLMAEQVNNPTLRDSIREILTDAGRKLPVIALVLALLPALPADAAPREVHATYAVDIMRS